MDIREREELTLAGGTLSIGLSGIASAIKRVEVSSHNIANLQTEDFRPLRSRQYSRDTGGSGVDVEPAAEPERVSVAREFVDTELAAVQAKASARVLKTDLEILGSILDILA
jgi:flagellar hook protein FlgE